MQQFRQQSPRPTSPPTPIPRQRTPTPPSPLLPAAELEQQSQTVWHSTDLYQAGLEIERPRSALHAGDFRDGKDGITETSRDQAPEILSTSPPAPWSAAFPAAFRATRSEGLEPYVGLPIPKRPQSRSRAVSQTSLSSSFQLLPPTSPLVQSSLNPDLDFSPKPLPQQRHRSPNRDGRRHTFSPQSFQHYQQQHGGRFSSSPQALPGLRREGTHPYQAHQPRRSISSLSHMVHQPGSNPQTPHLRPRRPSGSSDTSPLHHAPMVGSYEESILRGRMSTTPSRPLNFVAQIGVLGRGKCKSSLRCPPHVTVPFPAVFYSYGIGTGRVTDNQPSPYVGLIDLENHLIQDDKGRNPRPRSRQQRTFSSDDHDSDTHYLNNDSDHLATDTLSPIRLRKLENKKRRSQSPKQVRAPPGGSYRIPPVGQLQIVIKNPHKTAVKLFLVPYDLSDMEPGTKTFIRQRSYSAGPIIDMPLAARSNFGTDRPEASLSCSDDPRDRPVLRYLVHLNVCCLGKKGSERYYLYKSVRVVFANRVPDGKEKLRNEVQLPEPRYSVYKPTKDTTPQHHLPHSNLAQELASRRRSAAFPIEHLSLDAMDGIVNATVQSSKSRTAIEYIDFDTLSPAAASAPNGAYNSLQSDSADDLPPVPALPFPRRRLDTVLSRPDSRDTMDVDSSDTTSRSTSATYQLSDQPTSPVSPLSYLNQRRTSEAFVRNANGNLELSECMSVSPPVLDFKRSESPALNGGSASEGLLSRKLRNGN